MHTHTLVWIDHTEAKLFDIGAADPGTETIAEAGKSHSHRRDNDHVGHAQQASEHAFHAAVAKSLEGATGILITGPGQARTEFAHYLKDKAPAVSAKVWGVEPLDHLTDPQLIAHGRAFFTKEERMR
jgi:stalled ribosome rescue protein Dom34